MTAMTQKSATSGTDDINLPKRPPAWFVHAAWRVHRSLYKVSGGRFLWTPDPRTTFAGDTGCDTARARPVCGCCARPAGWAIRRRPKRRRWLAR